MEFFDTHCHLSARYLKEDLGATIARARSAGVGRMTVIGCGPTIEETEESVAIAEQFDGVYASVGLHPHESDRWTSAMEARLETLAAHPKVVAIGEMGLDYHYDHSPRDQQQAAFRAQIALAKRTNKPVVIHNRESDEDCIAILREPASAGIRGVIHCFTSSMALAECAMDLGLYVGFTGVVTFKNAENVREVMRAIRHDRIVIETDSPFLAPIPYRGKTNEPGFVPHVAAAVASTLGISLEDAARLTTENACRLYGVDL